MVNNRLREDEHRLHPHESDLVGQWISTAGKVEADSVCRRIEFLVSSVLEPLSRASGGWDTLYRDPSDLRLWQHTYPQGEMHGGGPPRLRVISESEAATKYPTPWGAIWVERRNVGWHAQQYLAGQLSGRDFLRIAPVHSTDAEVNEVIDLIEHEPRKGRFFGVSRHEYDKYMERIRELACSLEGRPQAG
jgi:hypothetical protein